MKIINFIKKNLFIQNFFASLVSLIHPYIDFTYSKYQAIKKAFYITAHDNVLGDYVEFGVFTGSSFNFAMKINKKIERIFGESQTSFFGFDSFSGFGKLNNEDQHPIFKDSLFEVNKKKIIKNIEKNSKGQNFKIVKGFFEDIMPNKNINEFGVNKLRIVLIDCDTKKAAKLALDFIKNSIQDGTIIMFDDYVFYKGRYDMGEYSAFEEFKKENKKFFFRRIFDYGYGSKAFIACINR